MKKGLKITLITIGSILAVLLITVVCVYFFVLQYPELKENPEVNKWYKVSAEGMKDSEGNKYHALFKKGESNNVLVYFAGGGVSVNAEMAKDDTYNTKLVQPDYLANITMNMGGLASDVKDSPFETWSMILFPYATGDFHSGTGEFKYIDKDGKEKILYHNGYNNFTLAMQKILKNAGISNPDSVFVTGYSAGGFAAALLSDDIYTNYFPNAKSKNVLVDASLLLYDDWHTVATNVWKTPETISNMLVSNNITLDCFRALNAKYGSNINLMFDCSTRDGDLAKVQNYFDNGEMIISEKIADNFQQILKDNIDNFINANVKLFIWDGIDWYGDERNMTAHTIISTPVVWAEFEELNKSVAEWIIDVLNGNLNNYGLELVNKEYPKTT